jgi:hemerythrin
MIETIEWNPTFVMGIRVLDEQHRRIINIINYLVVSHCPEVNSGAVDAALAALVVMASEHFSTEEQLLEKSGCPELGPHRAEHAAYQESFEALRESTGTPENSASLELVRFLKDWWEDHILIEDMRYRRYLLERGVE